MSRNMPAVDQNQLVRHFLKSHPDVSEILIKEFLVEHPVAANKLLRMFTRRRQNQSAGKRGSTADKENRGRPAVNGSSSSSTNGVPLAIAAPTTTSSSTLDLQQSAENNNNSTSGGGGGGEIGSEQELVDEEDEYSVVVGGVGSGSAAEDAETALEIIRERANELVKKKHQSYHRSSYLNYNDLTLAASQWNPAAKNLDAALTQHRTYLQEVAALDENELFMELIRDVANELDMEILCFKVMTNVVTLVGADRGSLFLTRKEGGQKLLVSKLFDVTAESTAAEIMKSKEMEVIVPFGRGIAGSVAETKQSINIKDAYSDARFNQDVDKVTGYKTSSLLALPILNRDGEVVGLAEIMNKKGGTHFNARDESIFARYLTFCGIGIQNAQLFEMSVQEHIRNQILLKLARGIFEEQQSLERVVHKILIESKALFKCEHICVFIVELPLEDEETRPDAEKVPKHVPASPAKIVLSSGFHIEVNKDDGVRNMSKEEIDKGLLATVAREVIFENRLRNIVSADEEPRLAEDPFTKDMAVRNLMCIPVHDAKNEIIGACLMLNKQLRNFTELDLDRVQSFAVFCGLGIYNAAAYERKVKLMAKQTVALEVLSYHATAPEEEVQQIMARAIPEAEEVKLNTWEFDDLPLSDMETIQCTLRIFVDTGISSSFKIPFDVLCRWALSVKKNYRPVLYHNWRHAFNVVQTMFCIITVGGLKAYFTDLDILALLTACISHDLDHRGTNNAFQTKSNTALAQLYGTSVLEKHHFNHCVMILQSPGNNIFGALNAEEYRHAIKMVEHNIISTDLALYFKKRDSFKQLVAYPDTDWSSGPAKELLSGMLMTACDLGAITKPWDIQQQVADLVAQEFFEQGDLEQQKFGAPTAPMFDRSKYPELPKMQVGFIDFICTPLYKAFSDFAPGLKPLYDGCATNRDMWNKTPVWDKNSAGHPPENRRISQDSGK
ncbi:cGMP-specific 3',5'-cyclic phosphodiesterase [Hypsibius exemplaris]|uniref:Phosphodiesterase n=1 Tax=Hypsibius exemplaris TaxID=2072580 RepID=A0A1W0XEN4_HYPEX|nr:cGMP-specific 3',5'-cyclic phosphodiesterase [Hypsibius exemplaris]